MSENFSFLPKIKVLKGQESIPNLKPGQLTHIVDCSRYASVDEALNVLFEEGFKYEPGTYSNECTFSFHVTDSEGNNEAFHPDNPFSIEHQDSGVAIVMSEKFSNNIVAGGVISDEKLQEMISGATTGEGSFESVTIDLNQAEKVLNDLGVFFPDETYGEDKGKAVNQFLYSAFVLRFYEDLRTYNKPSYFGVNSYGQKNTDGIVEPAMGIRLFDIQSDFSQNAIKYNIM